MGLQTGPQKPNMAPQMSSVCSAVVFVKLELAFLQTEKTPSRTHSQTRALGPLLSPSSIIYITCLFPVGILMPEDAPGTQAWLLGGPT